MTDSPKSLKERIALAKAKHDDDPTNDPDYDPNAYNTGSAMGDAMRVGVELVCAVGVGAFIGYWIDQWLGTAPFGMIVLFFMGFAAGFLNIYRAQTGTYHKTGTQQLTTAQKNGQKDAQNTSRNDHKE